MLCDCRFVYGLWELKIVCLFLFFCFFVFTLLLLINLFLLVCQKSKNHIKSRKSKKIDRYCWVLSQNMFYLVPLCIYEHSLFPTRSYYCGRNFEIYVTVVNRSSTLSWMISEWFVNLETCIDLRLYIFPLFILLFLLKELTKCKSPNEKRYWAAKACHTY